MRIDVVSIFPEYFRALEVSLPGKAIRAGLAELKLHDLREFAADRHRSVDDAPFGGGPGMIMTAPVWGRALDHVLETGPPGLTPRLVVPSPSGRRFVQGTASSYASEEWLIIACGRYEGIDARVVEDYSRRLPVDEVSIGDYVLAGGEVAALVILEASIRLLPRVLGNPDSAVDDSFGADCGGMLEAPAYTRPAVWRGLAVPDVLLSGDHDRVAQWRRQASADRTRRNRPDLIGEGE